MPGCLKYFRLNFQSPVPVPFAICEGKPIKAFLVLVFILIQLNISAQVNRNNTKKSIVYRSNYQRISPGCDAFHTLEIRDGTLWAWGRNIQGQLGDGTTTNRLSPVQIGLDNNWVQTSSGHEYSLGLKSDGTLWAWGKNNYGQLGDGTTANRLVPIQIGTDNKWTCISAGGDHSLGLKSNGTLWAWGWNDTGQIGDGTNTQRNSPVQIGADTKWIITVACDNHSLGLKSDGTLWSWGNNQFGQLGIGTTSSQEVNPTQVGTDNNWVAISGGGYHSHGLKSNGTLWSWGNNVLGQLGDGTNIQRTSPVQIGIDNKWVSISSGYYHNLCLKSDGTLWAWGTNSNGRLGDGTTTDRNSPVQIGIDNKWLGVAAGFENSRGTKSDGTLWAWGYNGQGQIGNGTTTDQQSPLQTSVTLSVWLSISAGTNYSLGLKTNGTLWAWGQNIYGQLGDGTTANRTAPVQIGTDNKWTSVSGGRNFSVGLKSNGTLWAWGNNISGQLGDGTNTNHSLPAQIGIDNKWVSISAGDYNALGLKSDGTLWAWGYNGNYQSGNGDVLGTNLNIPVKIGTDTNWVSVSAGPNHSLGLKSNGTLWAWGDNSTGDLGDGTTTDKLSPFQIGTEVKWISISADGYRSFGLKSDGTLWAWGYNNGQLGDSTTLQRNSPVQIGADNKWINISEGQGEFHSIALKSNGVFWGWGENILGGLGNGTNISQMIPVQIGIDNNWVFITTGFKHSVGLKADRNQFCATGYNLYGQLGDGTNTNANTFTCSAFSPLPIELLSFDAKCNNSNVTLNWATSSETNNDFFSIEGSIDAVNFTEIANVKGAGNSTIKREYNYLTAKPKIETNYYRLKQTDYDGNFSYSGTISVHCSKNGLISVFPNPGNGTFTVSGTEINDEIIITNNLSQIVYKTKASNPLSLIELNNCSKGIYLMQIQTTKKLFYSKLIVE